MVTFCFHLEAGEDSPFIRVIKKELVRGSPFYQVCLAYSTPFRGNLTYQFGKTSQSLTSYLSQKGENDLAEFKFCRSVGGTDSKWQ